MRKASASSSCRGVLCCAREIERERERTRRRRGFRSQCWRFRGCAVTTVCSRCSLASLFFSLPLSLSLSSQNSLSSVAIAVVIRKRFFAKFFGLLLRFLFLIFFLFRKFLVVFLGAQER